MILRIIYFRFWSQFLEAFISVKNLTKRYGSCVALENISFEIPEGAIVGIVGPNSSGKSTLLKILAGLISATSGSIKIQGRSIEENQEYCKIGASFRNSLLPKHLKVGEYLRLQAKLKGVKTKDIYLHVEKLLKQIGLLQDYRHRLIGELSEGILRCIKTAEAFIGAPHLILLDDPMMGLDAQQTSYLQKFIPNYKGKRTIFLSGQNSSSMEQVYDYELMLFQGRLVTREGYSIKAS